MKINIKKYVDTSGLTKSELARKLNISYPTMLSLYKGGITNIRLDILEKLCIIFNCTPNDILSIEYPNDNSTEKNIEVDKVCEQIPFINQSNICTSHFDEIIENAQINYKIELSSDGEKIAIPYFKLKNNSILKDKQDDTSK